MTLLKQRNNYLSPAVMERMVNNRRVKCIILIVSEIAIFSTRNQFLYNCSIRSIVFTNCLTNCFHKIIRKQICRTFSSWCCSPTGDWFVQGSATAEDGKSQFTILNFHSWTANVLLINLLSYLKYDFSIKISSAGFV